jgi:chromate transporter
MSEPLRSRGELRRLALFFLRLGVTAFGGPAAHIAMMRREVVARRRWLTDPEFLDLLGATNLLPGPNSTEMVMHVGHRRAGFAGLVVAGSCFIAPAMLITLAFAWGYVRFGSLPRAEGFLYGIKPVIIAIVAQALLGLARSAVKDAFLAAVAVGAALLCLAGVHELVVLAGGGIAVAVLRGASRRAGPPVLSAAAPGLPAALTGAAVPAAAALATPFAFAPMFLFFLKVGAVLYGSGYVLLAFLRADLVDRWQWLTESQLLDAVAVGQMTPGPVFTAATFIGYLLGAVPGAGLATLGIFLPSFLFVALAGPIIPRLRRSRTAGLVLDGVNAASLALMGVVLLYLARTALVDLPAVLIGIAGAVLLFTLRVNSALLALGGALAGLAVFGIRT